MLNKDIFRLQLRKAIEESNFSQAEIARRLKVNPATITGWLNGRNDVNSTKIIEIAAVFHKKPQWFFDDNAFSESGLKEIKVVTPTLNIPVYGQIVAGYPNGYDDDRLGYLPVPEKYVKEYGKDNLLALKIVGTSMNKKITDGSIALIYKTTEFENGDIMAVIIDGDKATLKHLYKYPKFLRFEPDSYDPEQRPFQYTNTQIENNEPSVIVIGKYLYSSSPELVD
ncbi:LexA family protein [Oenococcus alcoholitolerans]|uniref:LexA family protein n=1 Tax=Oenococcus alcoholitolerans TaxID=931074 RepID=UPI003F707E3E